MSAPSSVDTAQNQPESASRRDSLRSPESGRPKWKFLSYHLQAGADGRYAVEDETLVLDSQTGDYRSNVVNTSITLTETLQRKLSNGDVSPDDVVAQCNGIRAKLDEKGVKIFYDGKNGKLYPKWKYSSPTGSKKEEPITDVPVEILEMVKTNPEYFNAPQYKNWFGPRMQNKREQVISDVLAESYPDASAPGSKETTNQGETVTETQTAEKSPVRLAYEAAAEGLVATLASKYKLPAQAEEFVTDATDFALMFFTHAQRGAKPLPQAATKNYLRQALITSYGEDAPVRAAIDKILPSETVAPEDMEAAPRVTPAAEMPQQAVASPDEEAPSDALERAQEQNDAIDAREAAFAKDVEQNYASLRDMAASNTTVEDLDEYVQRLKGWRNQGSPARQKAVATLLADLELGVVGPLSEVRLTGLSRSSAEKALLAERPELNTRNVRVDEARGLLAYIDRHDVGGSMNRLISRIADAALKGVPGTDEKMAGDIAAFLSNVLQGKGLNHMAERVRQGLTSKLVSFNDTDFRLEFKDVEAFRQSLAGIASLIRQKQQ